MPSTDPLDYLKRHVRWPYDRLRERWFSPRKNPLPIPAAGIFDAPYACVKINYLWVSHIIGVLEALLDLDSWQGTDEAQYLAKQEIEKLLAMLDTACPEEEIVTAWRFTETCDLEYSNDNGETWNQVPGWGDFAEACFQGATGTQGPPGETGPTGPEGPPGADGECPECDERDAPENPEETTDGLHCSIAVNLTQELRRLWLQGYEDANNFVDQYVQGILTVVGLVALVVPGVNIAVGAAALLAAALVEIFQIAENGEANSFDDPAEERIRCYIYCRLLEQPDNTISQDLLDAWADDIRGDPLMPSGQSEALAKVLESVPREQWQWIAYASSVIDPAACDCECAGECPEEVFDWSEIGATPEGWFSAETMDFTGWTGDLTGLDQGDTNYACTRAENDDWLNNRLATTGVPGKIGIRYVLTEPCDVVRIRFTYSVGNGNSKRMAIGVKTAAGYEIIQNTLYTAVTPFTQSIDWLGAKSAIEEIYFLAAHGGTSGAPQRITFCGINEPTE